MNITPQMLEFCRADNVKPCPEFHGMVPEGAVRLVRVAGPNWPRTEYLEAYLNEADMVLEAASVSRHTRETGHASHLNGDGFRTDWWRRWPGLRIVRSMDVSRAPNSVTITLEPA